MIYTLCDGVMRVYRTGHGYHIVGYNIGKNENSINNLRLFLGDDVRRIELDSHKPSYLKQTLFCVKKYYNGEKVYKSTEEILDMPLSESEYDEYGFSMDKVIWFE
jgi:hypothetical protein